MIRPGARGLTYPAADEPVTREMLTRLDELNPCSEHWLLSSLALLISAAGAVVFGRLADKLGRAHRARLRPARPPSSARSTPSAPASRTTAR
jgi:MFS family permease